MNGAPDSSWQAARAYIAREKTGRHHVKQSLGAEVVSVYSLKGEKVTASVCQVELVGAGACEVMSNNLTALVVVATVGVGEAGDLGAQSVLNDGLPTHHLEFETIARQARKVGCVSVWAPKVIPR